MWFLFTHTLPQALGRMAPDSPFRRGFIVNLSVVIMFGYFGLAGFIGYGEPSHTLSALSLCLIPIMLILCWPRGAGCEPRGSRPRPDGPQSLRPSAITASTAICRPQAVR